MSSGRHSRYLAAALLVGTLVPLAISKDVDLTKQREEQKKIKARVEEAARQAGSTLSAMRYQRLSPSTEQTILEDVAKGLRGLSESELKEVLAKLDAAIVAPDDATATKEQKEAYAKQREIVTKLRGYAGKLDVLRNLDEAANQLDAAAEKQLTINAETLTNARLPRPTGRRQIVDDREELSAEEGDLRIEVASIFERVRQVVPSLTPEQKERLDRAEALKRGDSLLGDIDVTIRTLRNAQFDDAGDRQRRHAKELQKLAAALRTPAGDRLAALKAAQEKVVKAIDAQTKVNNDTEEKPTKNEVEKALKNRQDPNVVRGNELANEQTKAEFAANNARLAAQEVAPEAARKIEPAETNQWKAEDNLRAGKIDDAKPQQEKALDELKAAKNELDRQIAAAELAKTDPLAAVKQASEKIEQLIKDQKDTNKTTADAEKNTSKLKDAKEAQKEVAKATDEVRNSPLPPNADVKNALDKAAEAMKQANKNLDKKDIPAAKPEQKNALQALEDAKKALDQQAQAIEQRREDIAKLEELKNKLDELAKNEKDVAKDANKAAVDPKKPETGDIAKKQDELTPPTKDVGEQLKDIANQSKASDPKSAEKLNEAANKVQNANMKQEGAKNDLNMNMPMAGGEKAKDAAEKLEQAAKDVQDQIDQKKGMEANDQAALQPNKVDAQAAAQQLQKAAEQANMAAQKANEANMAVNPQMMNDMGMPNLAELQKQIAKQANDQKLPDAAKAADMAAKALEKGDIPNAIENQQQALDQLKQAAKAQPKEGMQPGEKGMQPGGEKGMQPGGEKGMQPGGEKGMQPSGEKGMGMGMNPPIPGELAKTQQQVLDATRALQQSQQATNAAQAALQQAQANAPMAVQGQLNQANNNLQQAANQLQQGQPGQAGMNQQNAAQQIQQALNALNAAQQQAMGMGMGMGMGMEMAQGMGMGMEKGMGMGMDKGMAQGMGMDKGMAQGMGMGMGMNDQTMNQTMSEGDMNGAEKLKQTGSSGVQATGDGTFINLRKKERENVQQVTDAQFPAEFRELIKQYNVNIKNAKPTPPNGK
jgi:hypothetical protein